jgi:proteasome assembly chaperone (PAC2) family protein
LVEQWRAKPFASIDPENFYSFTDTRPTIRIGEARQRSLEWPSNHFYAKRLPDAEHDLVLLVGTEPNLKWRAFCSSILELTEKLSTSSLVTCGALLADVPHTVDTRITGFTTSPGLVPDLHALGVSASSYEGPTGIIGALHDAWRQTDRPALSLWGSVPHYISATPNPQVSLDLLRRTAVALRLELPLGRLERQARKFREQIDSALLENPEAVEYVRQLEENVAGEEPSVPSPQLIEELEQYLRSRRPPGETGDESPGGEPS